ncbi:PDR/VanB family oxidoreductase [Gordonia sp. CPCC 205333]|uniref:PDR/VanB family oxidoreductase n=1 Tax=Gordonia sp. CPCC 205333 TaxID=3140790 RepID=UPI003AF3519B
MNDRYAPGPQVTEPPSLNGRWQRDPALRFGTKLLKTWFPLWGSMSPLRDGAENDSTLLVRIVARTKVAEDENVIALTLADANGGPLPMWRAGAHLDLLLPSGRMREYSLCGDPATSDYYRIAVRRIPNGGGGSTEVHDTLTIGDTVKIKGPRNAFPIALPGFGSTATHLRFIAGGIGITPILPMLASAERLGLNWSMMYTGRSLDSIPFRDELTQYGDKITIRTDDTHGLPTMAELTGGSPTTGPAPGTAIYTCGPVPMLEGLRTYLRDRPDIELHYERFSPPPVENGNDFTIRLTSTNDEITVAANESMLTALRRVNPAVPYSCQQGFCGTCKIRATAGTIDHRDMTLTDTERDQGYLLTCVSRATGQLTLDI